MAEEKGIKETLELIEGLKALAIATRAVLKDGKLNAADLPVLLDLSKKYQVLVDAVAGVKDVVPEVKDLNTTELAALGAALLDAFKAVKES